VKVTIPCKLPSANWLFVKQRNKWIKNDEKRNIIGLFALHMAELRNRKVSESGLFIFDIFMPDEKKDPDNYGYVAVKCFFDTAQKIGYMPNDNYRYVKSIIMNFHIDRKNPRIEVSL
jgi:hypothetical protein